MGATMRLLRFALTVTFSSLVMIGCQSESESARDEIENLGLEFTPDAFVFYAEHGSPDSLWAVGLYIKAGMDPNVVNRHGWTALARAMLARNPEAVKLLLDAGAEPIVNPKNVLTCCDSDIIWLLIKAGGDVNGPNGSGDTLLSFAAREGNAGIVRMLISAGADVNVSNALGQTPLSNAVSKGHTHVADLLRAEGASTDP